MPAVSIAMATYNGAAHLTEQLDSILQQGFSDFELVIADDASTDNTRSILKDYAQKDDRIRLFYNETNLGYRNTFYLALSKCRGEHILFSDQDDKWLPGKIQTLLDTIGDSLLVFSDSTLIDETGKDMGLKLSDTVNMLQPGRPKINRGFVIGNCVWGHTILFHRSLLDYTSLVVNEHPHDWWFAVVSSHLNRIKYCSQSLNEYRQHAENITRAVPTAEMKRTRVRGRKQAEYGEQLARLASIKELPFNADKAFYEKWHRLFMKRTKGFSFSLFGFLFSHRKDIFCMKKKNWLSQLISIRKMCRGSVVILNKSS